MTPAAWWGVYAVVVGALFYWAYRLVDDAEQRDEARRAREQEK